MTREPEWDDLTQQRALAIVADESRRCSQCGNADSLVLDADAPVVPVGWPGGPTYDVTQYRCLACASTEIVRRDWRKAHEGDEEPKKGAAAPGDARSFIATPHIEEDVHG